MIQYVSLKIVLNAANGVVADIL